MLALSAAVGAGVGVIGTILTNLFLIGQRRAKTTRQIVQAQRVVIEDLREAYEKAAQNSGLNRWRDSPSHVGTPD